MKLNIDILSQVTVFSKYAKFLPEKNRRETWAEICERNIQMHSEKFPELADEIRKVYEDFVIPKKVLPSMRSLQFAGKPAKISPNRIYNCAYMPINSYQSFSETMFLLLGGTGVGYSVQKSHIEELPEIKKSEKTRRYVVADSIEGWADSVKMLMRSYFEGRPVPNFDFSDIRKKGMPLITSGGKAPGPEPLKTCLFKIKTILDRKENGEQLTSLEVHDIMCHIADAVLSGGIRRAAMISLFDIDDEDMLTCKFGTWYETEPQRGRANNSAVIVRHKISKEKFLEVWKKVEASGSGEPGLYFTNNENWGTNPCVEIALRPFQMCNLTEINGSNITTQEDFNARAEAAAFIGTLQASYTNFHYLRSIWQKTVEREALLGVSITGVANKNLLALDESQAAQVAVDTNKKIAKRLGINPASRVTCIKPAGTTSLVLGTSSGIHPWHDEYYVRNVRFGKNEAIYQYLKENLPELVQDEFFKPTTQSVLGIPVKAPEGAITRDEGTFELLERVKRFSENWISPGHVKGDNSHNISATISVKPEEWAAVGEWMWENREIYNGLSVLPHDGGTYKQAPFETCDKNTFEKLSGSLHKIDLTKVLEIDDDTDLSGEIACAGGKCEI